MTVTLIPKTPEIYRPFADPVSLARVFSEQPPPVPWLIKERVQLGRGGLLTGLGGTSKTRLLYHLAFGSTLGYLPWNWSVEKTGKAVLVLTEDTPDDVHRCMYQIGEQSGLNRDEQRAVTENVIVFALAGMDTLFLARNERRALSKTPNFQDLQTVIDALGDVVFVGIDPALSITEGDESSQADQRALGKMADDLAIATGATVLMASHSPKGSQHVEELASHNSRGGGAITDAVRMEFSMRSMTADEAQKARIVDLEERRRHVQLVATKGNHIPPAAFVPVWLRRGDHGVLKAADVSFDDTETMGPQDDAALNVLRDMALDKTPRLDDWRERCVAEGILRQKAVDAQRKAMSRIVGRLQSAGLIERGFGRGFYQPVTNQ